MIEIVAGAPVVVPRVLAVLLLLLALATATWGALIINPGLLGGEVVISSATVVHSNIHVVKDRGMY